MKWATGKRAKVCQQRILASKATGRRTDVISSWKNGTMPDDATNDMKPESNPFWPVVAFENGVHGSPKLVWVTVCGGNQAMRTEDYDGRCR